MRAVVAVLALVAVVVGAGPARAAEWGNIVPGTTTVEAVRALYGTPSRAAQTMVEGYQTVQWTYEGDRAPAGLQRMVVDYGLLRPKGYQPDVVRTFRIEPKPGVFGPRTVVEGWGLPDDEGTVGGQPAMLFKSGLVVYFDKETHHAVLMIFTIPQPGLVRDGSEE
jgi:hypothetical protein